MDNFNFNSNNLLNNNNDNFQEDLNIRKLQQNLIMMGFDIIMINKIISYFKIRTENEALDYLIKTEDGMWNHPFIPKEEINEPNNNNILERPKMMMNNVLSRIKSKEISNSINPSPSFKENEVNEFKIENDICEICGELKDFHNIKEFNINNNNNQNDNNIFNLININDDDNYFINNIKNININDNNKIINDNNKKDILIDDEDQKEEKEEINPNECPICMGEFENPVEIEKCKHKFCYECFNSYLVNLIKINNIDKIPCPKNKCFNQELTEEFFSQYLSQEDYFKYRQFKSQNEIARDTKKIFCPHCNSYAQIEREIEYYDSNNPNYKKSVLKCMNGHDFCSCGRPLHEKECFQDEKEFKELIELEKIKKCPKCGFLIKKNRGCNHMTCGNPLCKYEFCWLCMNEAVPNHYDYGPCAGRQFFDPDSLSYYLEQNYPYLGYIYNVLYCLFSFILFALCFILIPAIGVIVFSYGMIFEADEINDFIDNNMVKKVTFLICLCLAFCYQSIIYMFWILVFSVLALITFALVVVGLHYFLFKVILGRNTEELLNNNEIEMAHSINSIDNNNNNNNENENNNNNIENV